ncbi:MAG TPA: hypothetical protein VEI02_09290 [Planctomycetota bacterium]|nr:hypothetical protein [Planctomycetota bacterium]
MRIAAYFCVCAVAAGQGDATASRPVSARLGVDLPEGRVVWSFDVAPFPKTTGDDRAAAERRLSDVSITCIADCGLRVEDGWAPPGVYRVAVSRDPKGLRLVLAEGDGADARWVHALRATSESTAAPWSDRVGLERADGGISLRFGDVRATFPLHGVAARTTPRTPFLGGVAEMAVGAPPLDDRPVRDLRIGTLRLRRPGLPAAWAAFVQMDGADAALTFVAIDGPAFRVDASAAPTRPEAEEPTPSEKAERARAASRPARGRATATFVGKAVRRETPARTLSVDVVPPADGGDEAPWKVRVAALDGEASFVVTPRSFRDAARAVR